MFGLEKRVSRIKSCCTLALLAGVSGFFFAACNMPTGLGDVVDTKPPTVTIQTPTQNKSFGVMDMGKPIELSGIWSDDTEIKLTTQIIAAQGRRVLSSGEGTSYSVNSDGTWKANIYIPEPGEGGEAEYVIKVIARDTFQNEGADEVTVRVDVVAPWVEKSEILRYPNHATNFRQDPLREKKFYDALVDFYDDGAYRNINYENIDDFQNESFTVRVEINANFSGVAASRLFVLDEAGSRLNPEPLGLLPARCGNVNTPEAKMPEWDISAEMLRSWKETAYDRGAHYISFEIWAWNGTAWAGDWDTGHPIDPENEVVIRKKGIGGTVWYPEADRPHLSVRANSGGGMVTLDQESPLELEVYDDDELKKIYAVLVTREDYETVYRGAQSDENYLEDLRTNKDGKRDKLIEDLELGNSFTAGGTFGDRWNKVALPSSEPGEYRLIALANDSKRVLGEAGADGEWGAYPVLRVQVLNPVNPITIIEGPAENTFPKLGGTGGSKFSFHGYTIDKTGTMFVQIAWYPESSGKDRNQAIEALNITAGDSYAFNANPGAAPHILADGLHDGIHIWKLPVQQGEEMILNTNSYTRNRFSKEFDIVSDFMFNGQVENLPKDFVIHTRSKTNANDYKDFGFENYTEPPIIEVLVPFRDYLVHNTNSDLELHMRTTEGKVPLNPASLKITDVSPSNSDPDLGLQDTAAPAGEKKRTVTKDFIKNNFVEGTQRTYRFEAMNILGTPTQIDRRITMSNLPALLYITSSNAAGTYGIGTELRFEAVFSMPVKVDRKGGAGPRLKLYYNDPGTGEPEITPASGFYAATTADSSLAANTIVFTYTVPEGVKANPLYTSLKSIELNGATMETTEAGGGNAKIDLFNQDGSLQEMKAIGIDGMRPRITGATFTQTRLTSDPWPLGDSYFGKGKTITLRLHSDKEVRISGTPKASLDIAGITPKPAAAFTRVTHEAGGSTIYFSYTVADTVNVNSSPVSWDGTLVLDAGNNIADMYGNPVSLPALPLERRNGSYVTPAQRAAIITIPPAAPVFALYGTSGFTGNALAADETTGDVLFNNDVYIKITGAANTRRWYSVEGGNNPQDVSKTGGKIPDAKRQYNASTNYEPSRYRVTAWQEDYAGNRSGNAESRNVVINSRAPELSEINCSQANGSYRAGDKLTFRLVFSRPVRAKANSTAALTLKGTYTVKPGYTDGAVINMAAGTAAGTFSPIFAFDWNVEQNLRMMNIKAQGIILSGLEDEYGNPLKNYVYNPAPENAAQRPIQDDSSFNLNRDSSASTDGLVIDSKGPKIITWVPARPEINTPVLGNGGKLDGNQIKLTFDKKVLKQAGKNIIIRPWNEWAVPPVLSKTEFDSLYNADFYEVDKDMGGGGISNSGRITDSGRIQELRKRLKWLNSSGFTLTTNPVKASYTAPEKAAMLADRNDYNFYTYTTKGVINAGGKVRPDTTAQWVLAFRHDLFKSVERLREVYNAAHWNWYIIPSSSGLVEISDTVVTITLPVAADQIPAGRIWEVLMDEGAFRDMAGNDSEEIKPETAAGKGYRFWSPGTEAPVIRVDRYSQGDHYHGIFDADINCFNGFGVENRPKIDTRVRIDCETPGASIIYDTVRTKFRPEAASGPQSNVFTTNNLNTADSFFKHFNVVAGSINNTTGYNNNTIGNGGLKNGQTNQISLPRDGDGYFTGLLVPNTSDTDGGPLPNVNNGAILWSALETRGTNLVSGGVGGVLAVPVGNRRLYQSIQNDDTSFSYGNPVFDYRDPTTGENGRYFYAGDAYQDSEFGTGTMNHRDASGDNDSRRDNDSRLYTGRRDYITAAAQKKAVNYGDYAGPELGASAPSYEGVFKTTVLYRNPNNGGTYRIILQGFDTPTSSTIAGFPLNEYTVGTPDPGREELSYFSKMPWRYGNYTDPANMTPAQAGNSNHYIWVSWDIVCDWFQKGRGWVQKDASTSVQRNHNNYGAILSTYGAVTYRYTQHYTAGSQ